MPAPLLALVDVRQVHLDERDGERLERVVDRPRVVRPGPGIDDQAVGRPERLVEEADVLALVVRLPAAHLEIELARPRVDLRLQILDRLVAVDRLVAPTEQVEVDPVEDVDAHAATLVGRSRLSSAGLRRSSARADSTSLPHVGSPCALEEHEPRRRRRRTSCRGRARPGRVAVDPDGLRVELAPDGGERLVVAREAKRGDEPERDGLPVRKVVAGRRLERMGERVARGSAGCAARGRAGRRGRPRP